MFEIKVPALKINQPIGEFYISAISHEILLELSFANIRDMDNELDDFMGIQRKLSKSRVKEIQSYVENLDACFPTSIILAIKEDNCEWNEEENILIIRETEDIPKDKIAQILDGQHRIEGLKNLDPSIAFELNVSIFIDADMATQANIFATVNLAQTKVNRSLVYDLLSLDVVRSPLKSCHEITVALNDYENSPFYKRIKRLGVATPGLKKEILTQAVVVESLVPFISSKPGEDRNYFLQRIGLSKARGDELERHPFRNLWLNKEESTITRILINYFKAVKELWPSAWHDFERKGNVLPKSNGFRALMRFLKLKYGEIVNYEYGNVPDSNLFLPLLEKTKLKDNDFNIETFPPGASGEAKLFKILKEANNKNNKLL